MDKITDGLKHDGGKLRLSIVPAEAIEAIGAVMTHGAEKYGKDTYKQVEPKIEKFPVYGDTVGQYTGLRDKNGERIIEGDILRFPYPSTQNIYSVMWSGGSFVRKDPDGYYLSLNALNCDEYEVIGNIHDNPELLEGDD